MKNRHYHIRKCTHKALMEEVLQKFATYMRDPITVVGYLFIPGEWDADTAAPNLWSVAALVGHGSTPV
eukprot:8172197-Karenia_brevis.AAC.1